MLPNCLSGKGQRLKGLLIKREGTANMGQDGGRVLRQGVELRLQVGEQPAKSVRWWLCVTARRTGRHSHSMRLASGS